MHTKQASSKSSASVKETTESAQKATSKAVAPASRVPAWASAMNDQIPPSLALQDAGAIPGLRAKLAISQPNDHYEQEADRVAEQVMRMPKTGTPVMRNEESLMRKDMSGTPNAPDAPPIVHEVLRTEGQPLSKGVQASMESSFTQDFSQVRVHTDGQAAESARSVSALAYTVGSDVVFGKGQYRPETSEGQKLLAHELTHVVQQESGQAGISVEHATTGISTMPAAKLQRFGAEEHVRIGHLAVGPDETIDLGELVGQVSYGEMIAMGDYFESVQQILDLAKDNYTYQQVVYVLWKVNPSKHSMPLVSEAATIAAMDRYYELAAKNEAHFSTGSAPGRSNREQYIAGHKDAIEKAYWQGRTGIIQGVSWEGREAFANHFLTDAFAGGHIRTPRGEIQQYWNDKYPHFNENLINMLSCYMAEYLLMEDLIPILKPFSSITGLPFATLMIVILSKLKTAISEQIRELGGKKLAAYSFGDLLSKVMHDADNSGLEVISKRGPDGQKAWRAVGDEHLFSAPEDSQQARAQKQTQQMVTEAVQLSYAEGQRAFKAGAAHAGTAGEFSDPAKFAALDLIPVENTAAANPNPAYNWRVEGIRDLPKNVKDLLLDAFKSGKEVRQGLDGLNVPVTKHQGFTIPVINNDVGVDLHTGDAWAHIKGILLSCTIEMLARIGEGNVCPPPPDECRSAQQTGAGGAKSTSAEEAVPEQMVASGNAVSGAPVALQAKLTLNRPDDPYEQEADRMAEQVMRMPASPATVQRKCACGSVAGPTGECEACAAKRKALQRRATQSSTESAAPPIVNQVLSSGKGQPLDGGTRAFMEPRFGQDFSNVRVHTDGKAAESAHLVNALVYTVGSDVVFGKGQYQPETSEGQKLLAHELTHVVQQSHMPTANQPGNASSFMQRQAVPGQKSVSSMSTEEKLGEAISRSLKYLGPELLERVKELLTPESLAIMAVVTAAFIGSQVTPVGWIADILAGLALGVTVFFLGKEIFAIADHIAAFIRLSINATSENDLEEAGRHFAIAVTKAGVDIIMAILLHKAGKAIKSSIKGAGKGGGSGGEGEGEGEGEGKEGDKGKEGKGKSGQDEESSDEEEPPKDPAAKPLSRASDAKIEQAKFDKYSMDPNNEGNGGKWKAFQELGYDVQSESGRANGAQDVMGQLRAALPDAQANPGKVTPHGPRFEVEVPIRGPNGKGGTLFTVWQYDIGTDVPRLISNWLKVHR